MLRIHVRQVFSVHIHQALSGLGNHGSVGIRVFLINVLIKEKEIP